MDKKRRGPLTLIVTSRKARWTALIFGLLLPVLYALSFGPACWLAANTGTGQKVVRNVYFPIFSAIAYNRLPLTIHDAACEYAEWGIKPGRLMQARVDDGHAVTFGLFFVAP